MKLETYNTLAGQIKLIESALVELNKLFDNSPGAEVDELNNVITNKYPFNFSLDDLLDEVRIWQGDIDARCAVLLKKIPITCDQCVASMIQGQFCHETGCPNTNKVYDSETGEWNKPDNNDDDNDDDAPVWKDDSYLVDDDEAEPVYDGYHSETFDVHTDSISADYVQSLIDGDMSAEKIYDFFDVLNRDCKCAVFPDDSFDNYFVASETGGDKRMFTDEMIEKLDKVMDICIAYCKHSGERLNIYRMAHESLLRNVSSYQTRCNGKIA